MVSLVTVEDFRLRAFALLPYLNGIVGDGQVSGILQPCLEAAKDSLAQDCETYWEQKVIRQTKVADGDVYDVVEPPLPYHQGQFTQGTLPTWTTWRHPVVSVQKITLQFSSDLPVIEVPKEWVRLHPKYGRISLVPIGAAASLASGSGSWFLPLLSSNHPSPDIPQFCAIDYTAGWYDPKGTTLPDGSSNVREAILDLAYGNLLKRSLRLLPVSNNVDGFSQSFASPEAELKALDENRSKFMAWWRSHFRAPRMVML